MTGRPSYDPVALTPGSGPRGGTHRNPGPCARYGRPQSRQVSSTVCARSRIARRSTAAWSTTGSPTSTVAPT